MCEINLKSLSKKSKEEMKSIQKSWDCACVVRLRFYGNAPSVLLDNNIVTNSSFKCKCCQYLIIIFSFKSGKTEYCFSIQLFRTCTWTSNHEQKKKPFSDYHKLWNTSASVFKTLHFEELFRGQWFSFIFFFQQWPPVTSIKAENLQFPWTVIYWI